ncbi:hypothetical protein F8M41_015678 [Gigaspora margarita]|uniref:Uncharacterized protein n=1 Tax=Gigaspora margarita TaxID=4874 RepID=A0A8H4AQA3_GIGMA|nr:hypothetical protein F8M41_015678 [Gigaspora margarita]
MHYNITNAFTFLLLLVTLSTTIIAYDNNVKSEKLSIQRFNKRQYGDQGSLSFTISVSTSAPASASTSASSISAHAVTTGSSATTRTSTTTFNSASSKSAVTSVTTPTVTYLPTAQQQPTLNPSTTLNNEQAPPTYTGADIPTVLPDFLNSGNRAKYVTRWSIWCDCIMILSILYIF